MSGDDALWVDLMSAMSSVLGTDDEAIDLATDLLAAIQPHVERADGDAARLRSLAAIYEQPSNLGKTFASTVEAGWLDDDGAATDPDVLQRTTALLDAIVLQGVPTPRVYPVPDGGMQAEWTLGDREVSVTVEPGGTLYVIAVNVVSGDAEDATVVDDDVAEVLRLVVPDAS